MGEVTLNIGGRSYNVGCADGEEERLTSVASRIDAAARDLGPGAQSLGESRLLLMSALMVADRLDEAEQELAAARAAPTPAAAAPEPAKNASQDEAALAEAAASLQSAADRISALVGDEGAPIEAEAPSNVEPTKEAPAEESPQPRQQKSSAAAAAEKDLLSWIDKSPEADKAENAAAPESTPAPAPEPEPPHPLAQEDPPQAADETEAERLERLKEERNARRARRRERMARLSAKVANQLGDEPKTEG